MPVRSAFSFVSLVWLIAMGYWTQVLAYQTYLTSRFGSSTGDTTRTRREAHLKPTKGLSAKQAKPSIFHSSVRIFSNLVATGLVVLSLATVIVLVSSGMFSRRANISDITFDSTHFHPFGQTCRLDAAGFVPNSCSDVEIATTNASVWRAVGQALALHWQAAAAPFFVTSCIRSNPENVGWASLTFLAGYDSFPHCVPSTNGSQEIAGLAMAETTVRDDHPSGAYVVTVWCDKTMQESAAHTNSDGTMDLVMTNVKRTLISRDGMNSSEDVDGINTVITSSPLGARYKITSFAYSAVLDYTAKMAKSKVAWWNQGRLSKKIVSLTWDTGHTVANSAELVAFQVVLSLVAMALITSDFFLTVQGLKGFLQHKPVMTYDLLAGLERRRLLLLVVTLATLPSLLYADVARIYRGTANGDLIWSLSTILVGMFFAFSTLVAIVVVQHVPSPRPASLVSFSPALFAYSAMVAVICVWQSEYAAVAIEFNGAPMLLGMNVSGVVRPTGAYTTEGAKTVVAHNIAATVGAVAGCLVASIVYSAAARMAVTGRFFLDISWTNTNGFLHQCHLPNWITGLPLDQANAIKIGNKLFCKPSTQAVLGFAVVVNVQTDKYKVAPDTRTSSFSNHTLTLISIYHLVPTLVKTYTVVPEWMSPQVFGAIDKNVFTSASRGKRLGHAAYAHCRGACVN